MTRPDPSTLTPQTIVAFLADIFERRGGEAYLGEPVTMAEHMLQGAALAERAGQPEEIIVAALLHDIGHFTSGFGTFTMEDVEDRHHEDAGAAVLERFFPPIVTECVRHHVAAKRYLCATRPEYLHRLSDASLHSLKLQGGPMSADEVAAFEKNPYLSEIIAVRHLDDAGKRADMETPPFAHFAPMVQRIVDAHCGAAAGPCYMFNAADKPSLPWHEVPLVEATARSLRGYGSLVDNPERFEVEITRWPAQGWRPIDPGTGDEAGTVEGVFRTEWKGDILYGTNEAVGGEYVLGWSSDPQSASAKAPTAPRERVLLWHMNYHPDGGQLFYPLEQKPFVVPAALPGDDLRPEHVVAFWCDGTKGLYIHAGIWHEGVFPVSDSQRFLDRQGAVHARVSADIGAEFGVYLSVPLVPQTARG